MCLVILFSFVFRKPDFVIAITAEPTYFNKLKKHTYLTPSPPPQTILTAETEKNLLLMDLHDWIPPSSHHMSLTA